jgi:hypothetical protein
VLTGFERGDKLVFGDGHWGHHNNRGCLTR